MEREASEQSNQLRATKLAVGPATMIAAPQGPETTNSYAIESDIIRTHTVRTSLSIN
jgi:hypothetical protein